MAGWKRLEKYFSTEVGMCKYAREWTRIIILIKHKRISQFYLFDNIIEWKFPDFPRYFAKFPTIARSFPTATQFLTKVPVFPVACSCVFILNNFYRDSHQQEIEKRSKKIKSRIPMRTPGRPKMDINVAWHFRESANFAKEFIPSQAAYFRAIGWLNQDFSFWLFLDHFWPSL